jgi:two-component system cell cycle response regulator
MQLLIAEDDLTSSTMLQALVSKWGFEPVMASDGDSAWNILQGEHPPRLLLLDWEMPKRDGLSLCRMLRKQEATNPPYVILLTARQETRDIVEGLQAGANDFISKPFVNAELQARLQVGQRVLELQSRLHQALDSLAYQASHDALTKLLNRRSILDALNREMQRSARQNQPLCIGMCDIDHFKQINDRYGHQAGDHVLREVAQCFGSILRPYDHVGRYGGEEFLLLIPSEVHSGRDLFERIRLSIARQKIIYQQDVLHITISCGLTVYNPPEDQRSDNGLIADADAALYQAKAKGRNRLEFSAAD